MTLLLLLAAHQAAALDPEGVYIDADGVLKSRRVDEGRRLRELRAQAKKNKTTGQIGYVSLPRLLAEVRRKLEAGEKLADAERYVGGIVKLQYVFVYPDDADLVIAGRAEPIDATFPGRAVGARTGRPVLQLDDLVTALRTCGPGRAATDFGCTIELTREVQERILGALQERKAALQTEPRRAREAADAMAQAGGLQPIRFFNLDPQTRFAFVCLEADYLLKRHALGLDPSPVPEARSHLARMTQPTPMAHRFWFETDYEPLRVAAEGLAYEIRGRSLQIRTRRKFDEAAPDEADPTAREYAAQTTRSFERLAEHLPAWADLANCSDLGLLAALIGTDGLARKVGWDLDWVLKDYPVAKVPVPASAQTLVNTKVSSRTVLFAGGGVKLSMAEALGRRAGDEQGTLARRALRPEHGWSAIQPE
jgi:hypothetical protein